MKIKEYEYNVPSNFDLNIFINKVYSAISSMGYKADMHNDGGNYIIKSERDIGSIDMFLGRWQSLNISFKQTGETVKVRFYGQKVIDKIICMVTGIMFFFIPWVFCFITIASQNGLEKVAKTTMDDHIKKLENNLLDRN